MQEASLGFFQGRNQIGLKIDNFFLQELHSCIHPPSSYPGPRPRHLPPCEGPSVVVRGGVLEEPQLGRSGVRMPRGPRCFFGNCLHVRTLGHPGIQTTRAMPPLRPALCGAFEHVALRTVPLREEQPYWVETPSPSLNCPFFTSLFYLSSRFEKAVPRTKAAGIGGTCAAASCTDRRPPRWRLAATSSAWEGA